MANPVLTPKAFQAAGRATTGGVMTKENTANAIATLFGIFSIASFFGWQMTKVDQFTSFPGWLMIVGIGAFAVAMLLNFKQQMAMPLGIAYAILKGLFVGSFSHVLNYRYNGIALQALLATVAVFAVMLILWRTGVIKVTDRLRSIVTTATMAVFAMYLLSFVVSLFGVNVSFLNSPSPLGILMSVFVAGLAAFNLLLDFQNIDNGIRGGAPAHMAWFSGFGLLVHVAWMYLEIIRLFAKLNRR
jgi:uncharacterized YccA/Bax inhibitor family protein